MRSASSCWSPLSRPGLSRPIAISDILPIGQVLNLPYGAGHPVIPQWTGILLLPPFPFARTLMNIILGTPVMSHRDLTFGFHILLLSFHLRVLVALVYMALIVDAAGQLISSKQIGFWSPETRACCRKVHHAFMITAQEGNLRVGHQLDMRNNRCLFLSTCTVSAVSSVVREALFNWFWCSLRPGMFYVENTGTMAVAMFYVHSTRATFGSRQLSALFNAQQIAFWC